MKFLLRLSVVIVVCLSVIVGFGHPQAAQAQNAADQQLKAAAGKVDLNNAPIRLFRQFRGVFPTLAKEIVANAPYTQVEDVFKISGLTEQQKSLLEQYGDQFTVTPTTAALNEGNDRINDGAYN
jgi:photosystem II PsbU protein